MAEEKPPTEHAPYDRDPVPPPPPAPQPEPVPVDDAPIEGENDT